MRQLITQQHKNDTTQMLGVDWNNSLSYPSLIGSSGALTEHIQEMTPPHKLSLHVPMFFLRMGTFPHSLTCFGVAEIINAQQLVITSSQKTVAILRGKGRSLLRGKASLRNIPTHHIQISTHRICLETIRFIRMLFEHIDTALT